MLNLSKEWQKTTSTDPLSSRKEDRHPTLFGHPVFIYLFFIYHHLRLKNRGEIGTPDLVSSTLELSSSVLRAVLYVVMV